MLTLFVTFPPKGSSSVRVSTSGTEDNERCYQVVIEPIDGESTTETSLRAILVARPRYDAFLKQLYAQKALANIVPKPDKPKPSVSKMVFRPEDIEPFVEQAVLRAVTAAEKPIQLNLVGHGTASTDCRNNINLNPDPFLRGKIEAGYGRIDHEVGHIRRDVKGTKKDRPRAPHELPIGIELINRAFKEGGEPLQNILNLVMDRRADDHQRRDFPGNASSNRRRMGDLLPGERWIDGEVVQQPNGRSLACKTSVFTDFVYACKKRTRPRHAIVRTCVQRVHRAIGRVNKDQRKYEELLVVSKEVLALLNEHATDLEKEKQAFAQTMQQLFKAIFGEEADGKTQILFRQMMGRRLETQRRVNYHALPQVIRAISQKSKCAGQAPHGPGGKSDEKNIITLAHDPVAYERISSLVRDQAQRLSRIIAKFSSPKTTTLHGLDRGEVDLDALPLLVSGYADCMKMDLHTRVLSMALSVLVDVSGSMEGRHASRIGTTFNNALMGHERVIDSDLNGFNDVVYACGPACRNNAVASLKCGGGTNEHFATRVAGQWLKAQRRERKILLTICDGGPSDPDKVKKEVDALMRFGIIPIRVLVGVDAVPKTHPIDLMFNVWEEFFVELEKLFEKLICATLV